MEYRNFGRTGAKVSPLCMGCMMFGPKADAEMSAKMTDRCIEAGINFFDTADVYSRGTSEEFLGKALKANGKRDWIFLATKVHGRMSEDDPNMEGNGRRHIIEGCEASLKRLGTDWIDLYQIHRPRPEIAIDETLRAMDDLIRSGKVRYIGTSTFAAWQVVESLWVSKELGLNRFVCEQTPYHLLDRRIERELVPMAQTFGIALIPWSPLASGMLTGKYKRGEDPPEGARLQKDNWRGKQLEVSGAFDVIEKVVELAKAKGCTPAQLSLAWNMHQPGITSPIIGPKNLEQLDDNLGAIDVEITDDGRKALDEVAKPGEHTVSYYNANFGPHQYRW